MGFILSVEEAQALIALDPRNKDVLFPYLNGDDLNSRPDQSPSRWVINFFDWPLDRSAEGSWVDSDERQRKIWLREGHVPADYAEPVAADFPSCLAIIEARVKPERTRLDDGGNFSLRYPLYLRWWQYADKRPELYATIDGIDRALVRARVSNLNSVCFFPCDQIVSDATVVFASDQSSFFALLQSSIHTVWLERLSSSMRTDVRYTPSDCFETFAFPEAMRLLDDIGGVYDQLRRCVLSERCEGLTAIYKRFHDPDESAVDISRLRELHVEMDMAVATAYGWENLNFSHGFHESRQGIRFTISEDARQEVLDRLLELNHQLYADEIEAGLHDKGAKRPKASKRRPTIAGDRGKIVQPDLDLGFQLDLRRPR